MKNTPEDLAAFEKMKAGGISAQGFLGDDKRSLADIIEADAEAFRRHKLDRDGVADFLEELRDKGQKGLGEPISIGGRWVVSSGDARGTLPCPWGDGVFHKNSIQVFDEQNGIELVYSDLSIHLLREHGFCQGKGSPFRLDPADLAGVMR